MKYPCTKQTTIAFIVKNNQVISFGTNFIQNYQAECPRSGLPTGVGYDLCKSVCDQPAHAEANACYEAGENAKDGILYLIGHYYICDNCKKIMKRFGIKKYIILATKEEMNL